MTLRVQRLDPRAQLPSQAHAGDAGFDLHALDGGTLEPGARAMVGTGVALALPGGFAGLVLPRSGLAARYGISVVNAPGLIDEGYRGEVKVLLLNTDADSAFTWQAGDRIAQLVLHRVEPVALIESDELDDTDRGAGGFGSSGT